MVEPQLACLGLSHRTAPVELRERVVCSLEDLRSAWATGHFEGISEYAVLSTCNRLELFAAIDPGITDSRQLLLSFLTAATGADITALDRNTYFYAGVESVKHLARVASGLESLVLGESQILGQVSRAHAEALAGHTICSVLDTAMLTAMRAGKRVHAETHISRKPVSISSVAVGTAERQLGPLNRHPVVVVGLGEMGTHALKTLRGRNAANITLVNRTVVRAERIAAEHGTEFCSLTDLPDAMAETDIIISATSGPGYVVDATMVAAAQQRRNYRPLLLIDIAVPRDIDPAAEEIEGVQYYDIDHLNQGVDEALAVRRRDVPQAEAIIDEECAGFDVALRRLTVEPIVADFRQRAETLRQQEVARTLRFIGPDIDPETVSHIQHLTQALVNKLLHEPTVRLKERAGDGQVDAYVTAFQDLFGLPSASDAPPDGANHNGKNRP